MPPLERWSLHAPPTDDRGSCSDKSSQSHSNPEKDDPMTTQIIDKMHAVAPTAGATTAPSLIRLPGDLGNERTLVGVLNDLGLTVPSSLSAAASSGKPLRARDHRYTTKVVDAALSNTDFYRQDRIRLKAANG